MYEVPMRKSYAQITASTILFLLLPLKSFAQTTQAEIIARVKKELVTVQSQVRPDRQEQIYDPGYYFFKSLGASGQENFVLASGFALPGGTHIATSARALGNLENLEVKADNGKILSAKVVGSDPALDLAILKLNNPGKIFAGLDFGDSRLEKVGDSVGVFGRSFRFVYFKTNLASTDSVEGPYGRHWLLAAPSNPAIAGGPIVDERGRVVAMAVYNPNGPDHFGAALPANHLRELSKDLLKFGKAKRSWLGIVPRARANIDQLDSIHGADVKSGILAENLIVEGPAAESGMQIGDYLLQADGKALKSVSDLMRLLERKKAGEAVLFKVFRANKGTFDLKVRLGELPNARELPNAENLL